MWIQGRAEENYQELAISLHRGLQPKNSGHQICVSNHRCFHTLNHLSIPCFTFLCWWLRVSSPQLTPVQCVNFYDFSLKKRIYFCFYLPVWLCICVSHVGGCLQRPEGGVRSPRAAVLGGCKPLTCVLANKLGSSWRAVSTINHRTISPVPKVIF